MLVVLVRNQGQHAAILQWKHAHCERIVLVTGPDQGTAREHRLAQVTVEPGSLLHLRQFDGLTLRFRVLPGQPQPAVENHRHYRQVLQDHLQIGCQHRAPAAAAPHLARQSRVQAVAAHPECNTKQDGRRH